MLSSGIVGEILTRFEESWAQDCCYENDCSYSRTILWSLWNYRSSKIQAWWEYSKGRLGLYTEGPVIAAVLEGVEAVAVTRKLVGSTEPKSAVAGSIRGDYCHMSYGRADSTGKGVPNLIHASESIDDAWRRKLGIGFQIAKYLNTRHCTRSLPDK